MGAFKSPTDNLSNDTPYAYSTDRIIIFIFHPLDTGVNKLSRGTRNAWLHSTLLLITFRMIPRLPIVMTWKLYFLFFTLLTPVSINCHVVLEMPKTRLHSTLLLISFRMIPRLPILLAKLKFTFFVILRFSSVFGRGPHVQLLEL